MKRILVVVFFLNLLIGCEAVFIEDISDSKVILLAPSDNSNLTSGSIQFNWESISDATEYKIQIASPNFDNATQIYLDSLTTSISISKDLIVGDYEWRVKAINSGYETSYSKNSFTVN